MQGTCKYQANPGYVSRKIADELLLVPVGTTTQEFNGIIRLNETSMFLWELLRFPQTIDDLVVSLKQEFNTKNIDVEKDVKEFINSILKINLIKEIK